jgi:hypothetical protein
MSEHNQAVSWRRVRALCVKETRQIVRDPSSWLIAVVIPLLLLFIFGYGINLDSSRLRVGVLLEQQRRDGSGAGYYRWQRAEHRQLCARLHGGYLANMATATRGRPGRKI